MRRDRKKQTCAVCETNPCEIITLASLAKQHADQAEEKKRFWDDVVLEYQQIARLADSHAMASLNRLPRRDTDKVSAYSAHNKSNA